VITKQIVKSCCGSKSLIFTTEKPVKKIFLDRFQQEGYLAHFSKVGLFYVQRRGLIATGSYGSTRIQVRCSPANEILIGEFEKLIDELTRA